MDSKRNVVTLLDTVERSLATSHFRNAYEANNTFTSNCERLEAAATTLKNMQLTGSEIDALQRRIASLREANESRADAFNGGPTSAVSAADQWLHQLEQEAKEADDDEEGSHPAKKRKEKKDKKDKKEKAAKHVELPPPAPTPKDKAPANAHAKQTSTQVMPPARVLLATPNCGFAGLPSAALEGKCTITQITNSPCVELCYERAVDTPSGVPSRCVAVMYRVVVAALWRGVPIAQAAQATTGSFAPPNLAGSPMDVHHSACATAGVTGDDSREKGEGSNEEAEESGSEGEEVIVEGDAVVDDTVREFSEKLVQEYCEAEAEDDAEDFARGRDAPSQIIIPTPHFQLAGAKPWAVLMCHGGYFAGGVFINGKAVVHRAFQRYVVRKKQGGMQSKADKTGGVMKSAGSQIRRHNELRWKVMVRDTLLEWKDHIDAAWIILYVAPGPDNRAVLTDFGNIPASFGGGSAKGVAKSPVDSRDLRVRSAPLTTHKPTFAEVQRIYNEVSRVSVRYEELA